MTMQGPVVSLGLAMILLGAVPIPGQGAEPYDPADGGLRTTIREVTERQTVRPAAGLEQRLREALRSINQVEGRADAAAAARLASELRIAGQEVERARVIGALGYREFDDEKFESAESKLETILAQFLGPRAPLTPAGYQAVGQALADVQALSRAVRLGVPGLMSDDVLLIRAKRQRLLNGSRQSDPSGSGSTQGAPTQNGTETGSPR